jgi:uncharacterized membrane protein YqgA involved in biofilm formation
MASIPTGAFLNAIGILVGAMIGLSQHKPLTLRSQLLYRNAIGGLTIFFGLRLIYVSLEGTFLPCLKQLLIALLSVLLGFWVGKLFRIQKISNHLGRMAGKIITAAQHQTAPNSADAFNACAILFCAAPLGIIGAIVDGLSDYYYLLGVKAVMDALAMTGIMKIFRWPAALSAFPVLVFFSAVSLAVELYVKPFLTPAELDSISVTAGLLACIITVVIFEVRKVELANYLPALAVAPLLVKLLD